MTTQTETRTKKSKFADIRIPVGTGSEELVLAIQHCDGCGLFPNTKVIVDRQKGIAKCACPHDDCQEQYALELIKQDGQWLIPSCKLRTDYQ